ncbi:BON domain-containing protein [Pseudanabaena sp. BC1403]|uniref:BON domain-containing protein n=1 Tax=Pseudanabaena sp. BC1403 TaxID=2043171 RepID=UPI000CD80378|nr:BON domain-containing protein [Pseudanabaena sp. BC1403]
MPTLIADKTDIDLKTDVLAELKYEPSIKVTDIGVLVKDGTVTLNGYANSSNEKWQAVQATRRVAGVKAIADDIVVKLPGSSLHTDGDIATTAAHHIDWFTSIPRGTIKVTVSDAWITLEGEVEWQYLKNSAENYLYNLLGVKGVSNLITVKPRLKATDINNDIRDAFKRSALLDANKIRVETSGDKVTLHGKVRNYAELDEAERVAWGASGVHSVDNQLKVEWFSFE